MGKAIIAFILSVGVGTWLSFFNHGIGVVVYLTVWDSRKKFQPWDDCSITKPKPKHAASLTLH